MKTYNVIEYRELPDGRHRQEISRKLTHARTAIDAIMAHHAPLFEATNKPDTDEAHAVLGAGHYIAAEPADPEDLAPKPQSPQFGALREAIARALIAEQLCEAAVAELARVAGLPVDTAYTCMLSLAEWIPGDPITDEQCQAFMETKA